MSGEVVAQQLAGIFLAANLIALAACVFEQRQAPGVPMLLCGVASVLLWLALGWRP